ncbi:hypothetical protein [Enterococcus xiangfangensis]|uniref:Uncharacterized protein n=1 Tax=Enterococcus xiangfangensis TaxID=1296537 RepID=A0ABU3FBQ6_9ENTE|nr:hypothetical protein [Enterococcus xiangfangensis]MDT2760091.1 hypothetical protein [Enterococcus xiangfangensis]
MRENRIKKRIDAPPVESFLFAGQAIHQHNAIGSKGISYSVTAFADTNSLMKVSEA